MLSTNVDRKGAAFVSSIEAKDMPIFATQFHPELQMDGTDFSGPVCRGQTPLKTAPDKGTISLRVSFP